MGTNPMPFPISLSGAVAVRGLTVEQTIARLEGALAHARAASLQREGRCLRFRGGVFRLVSNWNVLVPISNGLVEVSPLGDGVSISYRVKFTEMLVLATLMVGAFLGPVILTARDGSVMRSLGFLLFAWSWLFGGNFVLTRWRLPRFLIRSLSQPGA